MAELTGGHWVTINGTHIFIKDGMSVNEAFKNTTGKELSKKSAKDVVADYVKLTQGKNDPNITDAIEDYSLPENVRKQLNRIKNIKSYNDLQKFLGERGIQLSTDLEKLSKERPDDKNIKSVSELSQKIATGILTYESVFGKQSLSALKRVNLYDEKLKESAAFHFNQKGESDPLAGTIRFRDWNATGSTVFHELAHAYQASKAKKNEDAIKYSDRVVKSKKIKYKSIYGVNGEAENAEMMAEMISHTFTKNSQKARIEFNKLLK